jgi:hypothetical protein
MSEPNSQRVAQVVNAYLLNCHPSGVTLEVDKSGIHKVRGQWYVPVRPSAEPAKLYEYYEALTDIEMKLDEQEHLNVFLVPFDSKLSQAAGTEPQGDENGARPAVRPTSPTDG